MTLAEVMKQLKALGTEQNRKIYERHGADPARTFGVSYANLYAWVIETTIHKQQNRVRHEMNGALIAIGLHSDALEKRAMAVAAKIGTVVVDHGRTGCKTPDAATYIRKSQHRHQKSRQRQQRCVE